MNDRREPERLGEILRGFLRSSGLTGKFKNLEIYSAWEEVVGPDISRHTRVAGFTRHKLYVDVNSAAYLHELRTFSKQRILDDLRGKLPSVHIQDIVFQPAPMARP